MSKKLPNWKFMKYNGNLDRSYKVYVDGRIYDVENKTFLEQVNLYKKSAFNGTDYQGVIIRGYTSPQRVHRIVCETFHGAPKGDRNLVMHLDDDRSNNIVTNLKWVNASEAARRSRERNVYRRFPKRVIAQVKKLINKGFSNDTIARKVQMSDSNVSAIKHGYIHTDVRPLTEDQISLGNY